MSGDKLTLAEKILAGSGLVAVAVVAFSLTCLPNLIAVVLLARLDPAGLVLRGWVTSLWLAILITLLTVVADLLITLMVRRHSVTTLAGDFTRRFWVFVLTCIAIGISMKVVPGVTSHGAFPVVTLAAVSSLADLVVELVSQLKKMGGRGRL